MNDISKEILKLDDLKPDPNNPRKISQESLNALSCSMGEFGDISGITWNKQTGELVCGHQRIKALKEKHGDALTFDNNHIKTPTGEIFIVRTVDWDREKQQIANIVANSPMIAGQYTEEARDIMSDIKENTPPDEYNALLLDQLEAHLEEEHGGNGDLINGLTDPDDVPDAPEEPISKTGDLWILGEHRLLCGDCTKKEDVELVMGGEKGHIVVTDPPYGVNYEGGQHNKNKRGGFEGDKTTDLYIPACMMAFTFTDEAATLYLWHAGVKGNAAAAAAAAAAAGYEIRNEIVWHKTKAHYGAFAAQYMQKHEPLYYCFKRGKTARWHGPTNEVTVWEHDQPTINENHPTEKPTELFERAIRNSSEKGQIVCDWFSGSGTTIIAAEQLSRRCFAIEIEPKYVDVAVRRWEEFTGNKAKRST